MSIIDEKEKKLESLLEMPFFPGNKTALDILTQPFYIQADKKDKYIYKYCFFHEIRDIMNEDEPDVFSTFDIEQILLNYLTLGYIFINTLNGSCFNKIKTKEIRGLIKRTDNYDKNIGIMWFFEVNNVNYRVFSNLYCCNIGKSSYEVEGWEKIINIEDENESSSFIEFMGMSSMSFKKALEYIIK